MEYTCTECDARTTKSQFTHITTINWQAKPPTSTTVTCIVVHS